MMRMKKKRIKDLEYLINKLAKCCYKPVNDKNEGILLKYEKRKRQNKK